MIVAVAPVGFESVGENAYIRLAVEAVGENAHIRLAVEAG